jgi:endonuclease/exonuclease/phosphatase family metal-dependent hydrolase
MPSASHEADNALRVLHWNIHSWRDDAGRPNVESVTKLVKAIDPHVVSLVEVDESWGDHSSALGELAASTGYASIFAPAFEFGSDHPAGGFGNAILSKLPIQTVRQRQLVWPPRLYEGTEPSEPRTVLLIQVHANSGPIWIGSIHLPRADQNARIAALQRLATISGELTGPWLLVGDFNMPAATWQQQEPSFWAYSASDAPTYPARDPIEAIDYCVASLGLNIDVNVLNVPGSDHLPILVYYTLPSPIKR